MNLSVTTRLVSLSAQTTPAGKSIADLRTLVEGYSGAVLPWDSPAAVRLGGFSHLLGQLDDRTQEVTSLLWRATVGAITAALEPTDSTERPVDFDSFRDTIETYWNPSLRFSGYRIDPKPLGEGSFGKVYRAIRCHNGSLVAIKHYDGEQGSTSEALLREFSVLRHLASPHAVRAHSLEVASDGKAFLVMDYVTGRSLLHIWKQQFFFGQSVSLTQRASYATKMLKALAAIHAAGVVHGDIRLEHFLIPEDKDDLVMIDFGLGTFLDETKPHHCGHADDYMAPELKSGASPSPQSDLFALGNACLLLFSGKSLARLKRMEEHADQSVKVIVGFYVPAPFAAVITGMLHTNPQERYTHAGNALRDCPE